MSTTANGTEQHVGQDRCYSQRYNQRGQYGNDVGDTQWGEQFAFMPPRANSGRKTKITIIVLKTIERRTWRGRSIDDQQRMQLVGDNRFSFKRRKMFSTSTIASSTVRPWPRRCAQGHGVYRQMKDREHDSGHEQRERYGGQGDEGRTQIHQE